jgi:hypothetical protein
MREKARSLAWLPVAGYFGGHAHARARAHARGCIAADGFGWIAEVKRIGAVKITGTIESCRRNRKQKKAILEDNLPSDACAWCLSRLGGQTAGPLDTLTRSLVTLIGPFHMPPRAKRRPASPADRRCRHAGCRQVESRPRR